MKKVKKFYRKKRQQGAIYRSLLCVMLSLGFLLEFLSPISVQAAEIGENCNLHKGVTIGQENRGPRQGAPKIGNSVWIGVNATVVGNIRIGDDVLIAPNSFVNCDVPSHSVVFGNPCIIKHKENATEDYINCKVSS